jgi:hypothetical protein
VTELPFDSPGVRVECRARAPAGEDVCIEEQLDDLVRSVLAMLIGL